MCAVATGNFVDYFPHGFVRFALAAHAQYYSGFPFVSAGPQQGEQHRASTTKQKKHCTVKWSAGYRTTRAQEDLLEFLTILLIRSDDSKLLNFKMRTFVQNADFRLSVVVA